MDAVLGWKLVVSLPAILLIALLAGRLLGVQRSLAATALAGAAGWLSALALSLAIADGDPAAAGFTRNLWVFAIVFTMSATVWIELLAKPGALARAQSGLVSVPRPLRAVRRSSQRVSRYAQITGIAVKHGFGPALGLARRAGADEFVPSAPAARRLRLALEEECGGMFLTSSHGLSRGIPGSRCLSLAGISGALRACGRPALTGRSVPARLRLRDSPVGYCSTHGRQGRAADRGRNPRWGPQHRQPPQAGRLSAEQPGRPARGQPDEPRQRHRRRDLRRQMRVVGHHHDLDEVGATLAMIRFSRSSRPPTSTRR
jgi:hypothetical protein